jgi:N-methylhydantoinase B/oxoprolinase/acetone carboxylase alpha subunit
MWSRLIGVADEMWATVRRTAVSTIIGAAQDFGCELLAPDGSSLAHATRSMPAFNMVMPTLTRAVLDRFPVGVMKPGDVFITNDPWICCGHLDDIAVVSPVIRDGTVVAFAATAAHASSIGGALARQQVTDVYQEGLQIPIMRLFDDGEPNETAWEFIRANVRDPELVVTDIEAEVAANQVAGRRLQEIMDEYELKDLAEVTSAIQRVASKAMRAAIDSLCDGVYTSALRLDVVEGTIGLQVRVTVEGDTILVDYGGSAPQRLGHGLNCPLAYTRAHTVYALQCLLAPEVPANEGTLRSIIVVAPEGSVLSCRHPASVGNRMRVGWHIHPLLFSALESVVPERVQAGNGLMHMVRLQSERTDGSVTDVHLIAAGGRGAGRGKNGRGRDCFPSSARNVSIEELESRSPVLFTRRALRSDLAGEGEWTGAAGQEIEFVRAPQYDGTLRAFIDADYLRSGPRGVLGGKSGARFGVLRQGAPLTPDEIGTSGIEVPPDAGGIRLLVPGGGGYGRSPLRSNGTAGRKHWQ